MTQVPGYKQLQLSHLSQKIVVASYLDGSAFPPWPERQLASLGWSSLLYDGQASLLWEDLALYSKVLDHFQLWCDFVGKVRLVEYAVDFQTGFDLNVRPGSAVGRNSAYPIKAQCYSY